MNPVALVPLCGAQTITEVPVHSVPALFTDAAQEADPQAVTVQPVRTFVVTPALTGYPLPDGVEVVGLRELAAVLRETS